MFKAIVLILQIKKMEDIPIITILINNRYNTFSGHFSAFRYWSIGEISMLFCVQYFKKRKDGKQL